MGFQGISLWQLLIILAIAVLVFGTRRLRNLGSDLGEAVRSFRETTSELEKTRDDLKNPDRDNDTR
ncbi:MAG: twin-arginine translocase TatA/TatE family subunit [Gammaproteobacteria bacterium]|jgi:sec-independent protein translocase protein TatA